MQEVVSIEWAKQINKDFYELKEKLDELALDVYREKRESYEKWLIIKDVLEPFVKAKILVWQKENPHCTESNMLTWVRSFATSDQELILYSHVWYDLVKEGRIETESHGRGHPRTYLVRKG